MSATVHLSPGAWVAAHRLLLVLAAALVTAAVVLTVVLLTRPGVTSTPGAGRSLITVDDRCVEVGPATPC